jgi:transposase
MHPFEEDLELLDTIPGIGRRNAEDILAEIGTDMTRFPSAAPLASWAGMAPGHNESAGKRKSGRTRKGNKALRRTLVVAARSTTFTKTYLSAQYKRLSARKGANRAAMAVGHSILVIIYHILKKRQPYHELGADYFERRREKVVVHRSVKRLQSLGYQVQISKTGA